MPDPGAYAIGNDHWPGASRIIEEGGELLQVIGKLIGAAGRPEHWDGSNLPERLVEEIGDTLAALEFFVQVNGLPAQDIARRTTQKVALYRQWHANPTG
jgi:NTP pyrophosphatase (non-canonical NTP hydrolase)